MKKIVAIFLVSVMFLTLVSCGGGDKDKEIPVEDIDPVEMMAIPPIYDLVFDFSEGLAVVSVGGKWGYIDKTGEEVIPLIYDMAFEFSEGLAVVGNGEMFGYIDKTGAEALPFIYYRADSFSEGLAVVMPDDVESSYDAHLLYIDKEGNEITPKYHSTEPFSEGMACVQRGIMNFVFIDKEGNEVIPLSDDRPNRKGRSFSEGLSLISDPFDVSGFMDKTGAIVIPLENISSSIDVGDFSEGLASVERIGESYSCYIDTTGAQVLDPIYNIANEFTEGLALVSFELEWCYIDRTGEVIIEGDDYQWAYDFNEGYAGVAKDGKVGFLNKEGEMVVPLIYEYPNWQDTAFDEMLEMDLITGESMMHEYKVSDGMAAVRVDGKWGFINIADWLKGEDQ